MEKMQKLLCLTNYALSIYSSFSKHLWVPFKPLNQQNRPKNTQLLIQRFLWHSKKIIKLEKIYMAFSDFKCNHQQYSLFSKVPVCTQNKKTLMNLIFLYYPRPMYLGKHGITQFFPFFDSLSKPQDEAMLATKSGWTFGQAHIKNNEHSYLFVNSFLFILCIVCVLD